MGDILGVKFEAIDFIFQLYEIDDIELRRELFEKMQLIDEVKMKEKMKHATMQAQKSKSGKNR